MARTRNEAPGDATAGVRKNEIGEVVEANLDEVIKVGDPRHGVHDPLPPTRDALGVHAGQTPNEVFGDANVTVDLPESDLADASSHRGSAVRYVTPTQDTPEQVFAETEVADAGAGGEANAAQSAKAKADSKSGKS